MEKIKGGSSRKKEGFKVSQADPCAHIGNQNGRYDGLVATIKIT